METVFRTGEMGGAWIEQEYEFSATKRGRESVLASGSQDAVFEHAEGNG